MTHILLEQVSGALGEAYHWTHGAEGLAELEQAGTPFSPSYWTIQLPLKAWKGTERYTDVTDDDEDFAGVYYLAWENLNSPHFEPLRNSKHQVIREMYAGAYLMYCHPALNPKAQADRPETVVGDIGDEGLRHLGNEMGAADQHMRNWVEALLSGALDPEEGVLAAVTDQEAIAFYDSLRESAEADPTAHLRNRVPVADSNMVGLFG